MSVQYINHFKSEYTSRPHHSKLELSVDVFIKVFVSVYTLIKHQVRKDKMVRLINFNICFLYLWDFCRF